MTRTRPSALARRADKSAVMISLARAGFVANGLLHILIGGIAIGVAVGVGGEADQSGALGALASVPGGIVVLWLATVGLFGLGVWQLLQVLLVPSPDPKKKLARGFTEGAKGIGYVAIGVVALTYAFGGRHDSRDSSQALSARLLSTPGGVVLIVILGLVIIGIGVFFVARGIVRGFRRDLVLPGGAAGTAVTVLGTVGYIANGIAVFTVGVLFVAAGINSRPSQASGLDGALRSFLSLPAGPVILIAVGVGVVVFGLYFFAKARFAKF